MEEDRIEVPLYVSASVSFTELLLSITYSRSLFNDDISFVLGLNKCIQ